jgi:hypothetical protein
MAATKNPPNSGFFDLQPHRHLGCSEKLMSFCKRLQKLLTSKNLRAIIDL